MADAPDLGSYPELAVSAQSSQKRVLSSLSSRPANRIVPIRPVAADSSAKVVQKSGAPDHGPSATESLLDRGLDSGLSSAFLTFRRGEENSRAKALRPRGNGGTRRCGSDEPQEMTVRAPHGVWRIWRRGEHPFRAGPSSARLCGLPGTARARRPGSAT